VTEQQCEHNKYLGFFFVLLLSLAVTFLHSYGGNISITATRKTWVGYFVCLCVMEDRSCAAQWMVEGASTLKKVCGMDGGRQA
jgi:hypothetical protein